MGDIHYLWQPNRHAHLLTLAQAHALTKKRSISRPSRSISTAGSSPVRTASARTGRARSRRACAWSTGRWPGSWWPTRSPRICAIAGYARCTSTALSSAAGLPVHASAAHRLIGEAAGLFIAALTWPHWAESRGWAAKGDPRTRAGRADLSRWRKPRAIDSHSRVRPRAGASVPARRQGERQCSRPTSRRAPRRCSTSSLRLPTSAGTCRLRRLRRCDAALTRSLPRHGRDHVQARRLQAEGTRAR